METITDFSEWDQLSETYGLLEIYNNDKNTLYQSSDVVNIT